MQLPEDDEEFLNELGYSWTLQPDGADAGFLVIEGFNVVGGGFTPPTTRLMIRIPARYPLSKLDMWYCSPEIRFARNNTFPPQADVFETLFGVRWQRFSRHLPEGSWKAGVDGLKTFFRFILKELQGKGG